MQTAVSSRAGSFVWSVASVAAFLLLGWAVTHFGEPVPFVSLESSLLNHSTLIAWWLTWGCYPQVLGPIGVALLIIAWRAPAWRGRIFFSLAVVLACWFLADISQHLFARPRRLDWVVKHEHSFSYPSSHAAISVGFYGLWAWLVSSSTLPARRLVAGLLVLLVFAICWSRLALGAHYLTDLVGGGLLAAAIVFAGAGAIRR